MDFSALNAELNKTTPSRAAIIEELDVITDPLRGGIDTTAYVDELLTLFTRLIKFSQWHIQQDALSCSKYIFENSKLTQEEEKNILLKHTDFTEQMGVLLSDPKREIREMAGQCIGNFAIAIGPELILNDEFKLKEPIFNPKVTNFSLEGQQMALGRLASAFRYKSKESLKIILPYITNEDNFKKITNQNENGYVYWYSTRALLSFCDSKIDSVRINYQKEFDESLKFVFDNYKSEILNCAVLRLSHDYVHVRRTAAKIVSNIFLSMNEKREEFIESLIPKENQRWVSVEGYLCAIDGCLKVCKTPLETEYVEKLAQKLVALLKDPLECDHAPITQKGNANGWAGRALVSILWKHDKSFYEKYVHASVKYLLQHPVAALIDAGVICTAELKEIGGFDIEDLYILCFKNIFHASFPIRDLARRTVPSEKIINEKLDDLISVLKEFIKSSEPDVRESVCKAFQAIKNIKTEIKFTDDIIDLLNDLMSDSNDCVSVAAIDAFRLSLTNENIYRVPEIVKNILEGDSDDPIAAVIHLLKTSVELFKDDIIKKLYVFVPVLVFHAITSFSPNVSTTAQQLLTLLANDKQEIDENLYNKFKEIDIDSISPDELEEINEISNENEKAPATLIKVLTERFGEDLGIDSVDDYLSELSCNEENVEEIVDKIFNGERDEIIDKLCYVLTKIEEVPKDKLNKFMQILADVYADEQIEFESKKPLFFALNVMRTKPIFKGDKLRIPDPTPYSTTHASETFAKTQ